MYAKLGTIEYAGLISFSGMEKTDSVNYAEHALIYDTPRLQKVSSRNLREIPLNFHFSVAFCDPEEEAENLVLLMNAGEILPMVDGNGKSYGDYVITSITQTVNQTDTKGKWTDINLNLSLKEYIAPKTLGSKKSGFAKAENSPLKVKNLNRNQGQASAIQNTQTDIVSSQNKMDGALNNAKKQPTRFERFMSAASQAIGKIQAAHAKIDTQISAFQQKLEVIQDAADSVLQTVKDTQQRLERIKYALAAARSAAQNAYTQIQSGDIDGALAASRSLRRAHRRLYGANAETARLTGARKGY